MAQMILPMHQRSAFRVLLLVLVATAAPSFTFASSPAPAGGDLQSWWIDLQKSEPDASRALLNFSIHPDETVAFFRQRLRPLKLEVDELNLLLGFLASDKPSEWKPAFEQLEYLDPRLAMDLDALMKATPDNPARGRLVAVLCDYPPDTYKDKNIHLSSNGKGKDQFYNFSDGQSSWWAESKIDRIGATSWGTHKQKWQRAIRALVLLKHINTPDALAIIKDLSTGHPDAMPTKVAKEMLSAK
jgi:hypothetical protein